MDYRFYRGVRLEFPPAMIKHLHLLRYIGALMIAAFPLVGLLLLLNVLEINLFWSFAFFLFGGFGPVFFIIGMAYNSVGDRGEFRGLRWQLRYLGKPKPQIEYRPERKMIYAHYEAPEISGKADELEKS